MTSSLPAARLALQRLVLVAALLTGALCLLGAATLDLARSAAAASSRDGTAAADRSLRAAQSSAARAAAETGPPAVRVLLGAAGAGAGAVVVPDLDTGAGGSTQALLPGLHGGARVPLSSDGSTGGAGAGVDDRAPPLTAGT